MAKKKKKKQSQQKRKRKHLEQVALETSGSSGSASKSKATSPSKAHSSAKTPLVDAQTPKLGDSYPKMSIPKPRSSWERRFPWLLGLLGFLLYANTLGHLYALDDNLVIHGHKFVEKGVAGISDIWKTPFTYGATKHNDRGYRPFVLTVFALETEIFGQKAFFAQHLIHVLLYVLICFFLFMLLRRMFWKWGPYFPLVISLLYIAHPLHTEVVANLKSLDELIGLLCGFLLPTYLLFRFFDGQAKRFSPLIFAFVFFTMGIFSKENVISYVVVIPLTLFVFSELSWRQIARWCWPLLAIAGGFLWIRETVIRSYPIPEYSMMQNVLMGANTWVERYATAMLVMLKYLWLLIFPHPLAWDYSYKEITLVGLDDIRVWLSVLVHLGLLIYALIGIRTKQLYAYAILFYLTVISVSSNLFVMGDCTMGERFLFVPSLGFCIALTAALYSLFKLNGGSIKAQLRSPLFALVAVLIVAYSAKTYARNLDWKDTLTLSLADVKTNPKSVRIQSTLAAVYLVLAKREKEPAAQKRFYRLILPLAKEMLKLYPKHKEASYMLGISYYFLGDSKRAEKAFLSHLKLFPKDSKTLNNLGGLYYFRKDYVTAMDYFKRFVALHPKKVKAINNLGVVTLNQLKDPAGAAVYFKQAIKVDPTYGEPYKRMGDTWARRGQIFKAIPWYQKAAKVDPKKWGKLKNGIGQMLKQNWRRSKNVSNRFRRRKRNQGGVRGLRQFMRMPPGTKAPRLPHPPARRMPNVSMPH